MRAQFRFPGLPRNPLLRALVLAGGAIVLIGLLTIGFLVGAAVLAGAAAVLAVRSWRLRRAARAAEASIIDAEFTVVERAPPARLPRPD